MCQHFQINLVLSQLRGSAMVYHELPEFREIGFSGLRVYYGELGTLAKKTLVFLLDSVKINNFI